MGPVVNAVSECTLPEKVLLAALSLEEQGSSPFTAEVLTVAAWRKYPRTFGLKGFEEEHPDSNKVLTALMGEKGLARRGWLHKAGQKLYTLTREGRQLSRRLLQGEAPPAERPAAAVKLDRQHDKLLQGLLASTAYEKFRQTRQNELKFADACRFWGITENLSGEALDERLDLLEVTLAESERLLGAGSAVLSNGQAITGDDTGALCDLHGYLRQRFSPHLTLLRKRAERGS
jgi:hypothetical protein